jgi:hypothetical protein
MGDLLKLIWCTFIGLSRSRAALDAEIVALRHQLDVLRRNAPERLAFRTFDRLVFSSLYRIAPRVLNVLVIVKPETVIRWHHAGFACSGDGSRSLAAAEQRCRSKFAN